MKTVADGLGSAAGDHQAGGVLTALLDQLTMAIDLLGATVGLSVDLLRWMVVALAAVGVAALVHVQRSR